MRFSISIAQGRTHCRVCKERETDWRSLPMSVRKARNRQRHVHRFRIVRPVDVTPNQNRYQV